MLFYAIGKTRLSVHEATKGAIYRCPECQGRVALRGGPYRQLHFYHLNDSSSCRQSGKTLTHINLQLYLKNLLGAELEKRFPSISRIADVYCPTRKLVVEVQCSPITEEEMVRRNWDYHRLGLRVVWVLLSRRFWNADFDFPHYFTNGRIIYDRLRKEKFPVDLSQEICLPAKLPHFLRKRSIAFSGDLVDRCLKGLLKKEPRRSFWRPLWNLTLEMVSR